jgi:rhodanese-related sulfurtransferase
MNGHSILYTSQKYWFLVKNNTFDIQYNFMKNTWIILVLSLLLTNCGESQSLSITNFSQEGLQDYTILDVRTPEEFASGHLENAVNINWYDANFVDQLKEIPRENTLYVYCKKGGRSAKAAAMLDSLGYKVIDLQGGYDAYQAKQ